MEESSIDIIRRMNPGVDIPTGAEFAERIKKMMAEKSSELIKCPGCDTMLPKNDIDAQVAHMDEFHPDIIAQRRKGL